MYISLSRISIQQNELSEAEGDVAGGRSGIGKTDAVHTMIIIYPVRKREKWYT